MVYLARNTKDGKVYVGQTRISLSRRKRFHKDKANRGIQGRFFDAIREHGFDAFEWSVLSEVADSNEMNRREREAILAFRANDPEFGYNINLPHYTVTEIEANRAVARAFEMAFA